MKPSFAMAAGLAAAIMFAAPAYAVDIENADEDTHQISTSGENTEASKFELAPGTREAEICAGRCTVQVEGVGSIEADEDEVVVIRDGRLSKQPKQM